jgi:prephenate dehydratase
LLVTKRWATNNKLSKISGAKQMCRACKTDIKNLNHIFNECTIIKKVFASMAKEGTRNSVKMLNRTEGLLGPGTQFLNKTEVEIQAHTIEIVHNGLASNNNTNLDEDKAASTLIGKLKKRKIIKEKDRRQKASPIIKEKEDHPPLQNIWVYQG